MRLIKVLLLTFLFIFTALPAMADTYKILAFGDSLTAGYGLSQDKAFPVLLEQNLKADGYDVAVINAGVSGETTSGGLSRLDWTLQHEPDLVLLGLGANDALRKISPDLAKENLSKMIEKLQAKDIDVLLLGMYAPPNFGAEYGDQFNAIFPALTEEYDVKLYPFLLEGVAADRSLNQDDGLHPNEKGARIIADNLKPHVIPFLKD